MRFSVGDQVMISPDLPKFDTDKWPGINYQMMDEAGTVVTIRKCDDELGVYYFNEVKWSWLEEWLCPLDIQEDDVQNINLIAVL